MKRLAILVAALVCLWPGSPHAASFSLEQAVSRALDVNPTIQSKLLVLEQARMNVGVAQSYFWPRVSLVGSHSVLKNKKEVQTYSSDDMSSKTWTQGWRLTLSLFAGFAHLNNVQKSLLQVDVEDARHRQARLELITNVQLQFLALLQARENLSTAEESVRRIQKQLEASEAFVRVDMAPYANVLQNRVELSRAQQEVIRCRNDIRNAEVQLNRYLGFPPNERVTYAGRLKDFDGTVTYTEEQAIKTALYSRPDLIVAQKSVAVAFKDVHIAMGEVLPRVDASYDDMRYSRDFDDRRYNDYTRNYWAAGINFTWDVFSGGSAVFNTLAERNRAKALQKDFEDAMAGARTDVIRAMLDMDAAKELITTTRYGVDSARENYAMSQKRYMTNIGTITDLVDAQVRLTEAERDASQALADYHSARARFYFNIGRENPGLK